MLSIILSCLSKIFDLYFTGSLGDNYNVGGLVAASIVSFFAFVAMIVMLVLVVTWSVHLFLNDTSNIYFYVVFIMFIHYVYSFGVS